LEHIEEYAIHCKKTTNKHRRNRVAKMTDLEYQEFKSKKLWASSYKCLGHKWPYEDPRVDYKTLPCLLYGKREVQDVATKKPADESEIEDDENEMKDNENETEDNESETEDDNSKNEGIKLPSANLAFRPKNPH
jgi:hypothetical protein